MSFIPGQNIGAYRLLEQLGSGGMATVYKAYHAALDRYVAVKVLHPAFKGDLDFLTRFQREARVVAKLEHPYIVPVYDFSEHEGSPYLVMRFIEGETLKARLKQVPLTLPEILDVIRPVGEALTYAHKQGVLHRDIKPSNVLLAKDGRVFLTDFGLARIVQAGESSLTRDAMVGTPHYVSPEQALGKSELDAGTDIYSFGVVLYELFTGRVPFQSDTPIAVIHDHIYSPLPMPTAVNPDLPPALERVLLKALAKAPEDRYRSAVELVMAVDRAVTGVALVPPVRPVTAATPPPSALPTPKETAISQQVIEAADEVRARPTPEFRSKPSRRRIGRMAWLLALGGFTVLAVAAITVLLLLTGREDGQEPQQSAEPPVEQPVEHPRAVDEIPPGDDLPFLVEQGSELLARGDVDRASALFEEFIRRNPEAVPAYLEIAQLLFSQGIYEPAVPILRQGVRIHREEFALHLFLAQALVGADRWDEAVVEIEWLIERDPDLAEPHAYLSVYLAVIADDVGAAEREAFEAVRLDPESPAAHLAMGVFYWKTGNLRRARLELERVREIPDASPLLRQRVQLFLERLEQPDAAGP